MAAVVGSVPGSSNQKRVGFGSVEPALWSLGYVATAACGVVTSTDVADTDDGVTVVDPNLTDDVKARFAPVMVIS